MAASDLSLTIELTGNGVLSKALDLSTVTEPLNFGSGGWDQMQLSLSFGTASSQAKEWFQDERTILAGANDDLDLAGGLSSEIGGTLTFTVIKWLLVAIDAPDGTKSLRVGPQGVANGWQGPWGGTGATVYTTVFDWQPLVNDQWTGFAVTAGTGDILRINNPGAGSVTYRILIVGEV